MATQGVSLRVSSPLSLQALHRPFMGSALGYALTQPIYITLRFCISRPWHGTTNGHSELQQCSGKILPKPGPWMDTAKNVLAFPLYLTSVWLLWVAGNQSGVNTMALALSGLVLLAMAAYLYGESNVRKAISALLLIAAVALAIPKM